METQKSGNPATNLHWSTDIHMNGRKAQEWNTKKSYRNIGQYFKNIILHKTKVEE